MDKFIFCRSQLSAELFEILSLLPLYYLTISTSLMSIFNLRWLDMWLFESHDGWCTMSIHLISLLYDGINAHWLLLSLLIYIMSVFFDKTPIEGVFLRKMNNSFNFRYWYFWYLFFHPLPFLFLVLTPGIKLILR